MVGAPSAFLLFTPRLSIVYAPPVVSSSILLSLPTSATSTKPLITLRFLVLTVLVRNLRTSLSAVTSV